MKCICLVKLNIFDLIQPTSLHWHCVHTVVQYHPRYMLYAASVVAMHYCGRCALGMDNKLTMLMATAQTFLLQKYAKTQYL